jgi:hypothetical protein
MKEPTDINKSAYIEKQASISVVLVIAIIIMAAVYLGSAYSSENDSLFQGAVIAPFITILLGIYTFSYRGKNYLTSRVLFFIFLVLSILSIWALYYVTGLAKAFTH